MKSPIWSVLVLFAAGACDPEPKASPTDAPAKGVSAPPRGAASPLQRARKDVTRHMPDHFDSARDLVDAIIDGDVEQARKEATPLATHSPKSMPAEWFPYLERMRAAAGEVEKASDLASAGAAVGRVTHACGSCHAGQGKGPKTPAVPMPAVTDESCMLGHRWATDRLWFGVVASDDAAWEEGVKAFSERPACLKPGGEPLTDPDVFEKMRVKLEGQAAAAADAKDLDARARIYGEMLSTCGTCHVSGC